MYESGAHDLQAIEQALLVDDPQFINRFRQATQDLDEAIDGVGACPPGAVVVGVDGTLTSMRSVAWAAQQASASRAEIRIVHPFQPRGYPLEAGMAELYDLSRREAAQDICRSAVDLAAAVAPGCRVTGSLVSGPAAPGLLRAAGPGGLLVVSGPSPSMLGTLLRTATLPRLLEHGRCSLAAWPCDAGPGNPPVSSGRVSVVLTGGTGDTETMRWGLQVADAHGCGVTIACPPGLAAIAAATATLRTVRGRLPAPDVAWTTGSGPLASMKVQLQSSPAAVVIDRSAVSLAGFWRGRAGRQLLGQAGCPVLLTRTADVAGRSR